jgi:putative membrane protein
MIKNYATHAANERTYLAWIRTSIALIGLGFIIGKFEYFLVSFYQIDDIMKNNNQPFTKLAGLILMAIAFVILIGSTMQFLTYKKMIDAKEEKTYGGIMAKITLSVLLGSLIVFLLFYTEHLLFESPAITSEITWALFDTK